MTTLRDAAKTLGQTSIAPATHRLNEPSVDAVMARHGIPLAESFGLSGEEARAHMDCAALKTLRISGFDGEATLLANSAARASVIERSLSGYHGYGRMRGPA